MRHCTLLASFATGVMALALTRIATATEPTKTPSMHVQGGHDASPKGLVFSRDGKILVSGGADGVLYWDVATGREMRRLPSGAGGVSNLVLSPDGTRLLVAHEKRVRLIDLASSRSLVEIDRAYQTVLGFSADGATIFTRDKDKVEAWSARDGKPRPAPGSSEDVALSRNGCALAGDYDHHRRDDVPGLCIARDKTLWRSPDGKWLLFRGCPRNPVLSRVGAARPREIATAEGKTFTQACWSPNGGLLALAFRPGVELWDTERAARVALLDTPQSVFGVTFSPDGSIMAVGLLTGEIQLWDVATRRLLRTLEGRVDPIERLSMSRDGRRLLIGRRGGRLTLFDLGTGAVRSTPAHGEPVGTGLLLGDGGTIKARGFKVLRKKTSPRLDQRSSFQLLGELFADLRRGSGATVIASASGVELALESPEWNNGVFTYALLDGLQSGAADRDKSGETRISELRDWVTQRVRELTQGQQTPTVRQEQLDFDFVIY